MAINKKIKNSSPVSTNSINFKSKIELKIYETLVEQGITPDYELITFVLSEGCRPSVGFYNRTKMRGFHYEMNPLQSITYTPDFTFTYNGIFVIIEVKGYENDVFPIKRNLFRKRLEEYDGPVLFFEIRTKTELLLALNVIRMESSLMQFIRKNVNRLPDKDIAIANKFIEKRDFDSLVDLIDSAINRVNKNKEKYKDIEVAYLHKLKEAVNEYAEAQSI